MPHPLLCLSLPLALLASGCALTDPYERAGVWRPNGSNEANLVAMVATAGDLARGVGNGNSDGRQAEAALDRLRRDRVKALPDTGLAQLSLSSSGSATTAPAAP